MKSNKDIENALRREALAPTLNAIRRQITYLQEETRAQGYREISLFLGCAVLAIDDLKTNGQRVVAS